MIRFTPIPRKRPASTRELRRDVECRLKSFELEMNLILTIHDRVGLLVCTDGSVLLRRDRMFHRHPFCEHGRFRNAQWNRQCNAHCTVAVGERIVGGAFVHRCWKGGAEVVVPIVHDGLHALTFFAGVRRGEATEDPLAERDGTLRLIRKGLLPLPSLPARRQFVERMEALGKWLLEAVAPIAITVDSREGRIWRFLHANATKPVGLPDLARDLGLTPGHASREVVRLLGAPFQQLLRELRLSRAAMLLRTHDYPVGEVAHLVGFESEYHFNRAFSRRYGEAPGRWRHEAR